MEGATLGLERQQYPLDEPRLPTRDVGPRQGLLFEPEGVILEDHQAGGLYAIAEQLTRDGIPSPSAHDPERNRHRHGKAWSKMAVRAILANPRWTGRQV